MALHRETITEVNLSAIRHNLKIIKRLVGPSVKIMSIVKADAYGHGAIPCSKVAISSGSDYLGVGIVEEGIELRDNGIQAPILVMGGFFLDEIKNLIHNNLAAMLFSEKQLEELSKEAIRLKKKVSVHLKIDTGMNRLGVSPENFLKIVQKVIKNKNLSLEGICTHFSSADEANPSYTMEQLMRFDTALSQLTEAGFKLPMIHCANSSAILNFPESWRDLVRPGLTIYGALPSLQFKSKMERLIKDSKQRFRPAIQWKTKIIQIKHHPKGAFLSYGNNYQTKKESLIATLPLGYADGLARTLSNKIEMIIRGKRAPQVGNICMDMCLIDVTDIPDIAEGDEAIIFGQQGDLSISVEEMAEQAGLIPYEILCTVGKRVPRIYLS